MIFLALYCLLLFLLIFSASWRLSIAALGLQAIGMGAYLIVSSEASFLSHHSVAICELLLLKGLAVPAFLAYRFKRANLGRFIDLIPPNLLHWTIVVFFAAFSYLAAAELAPSSSQEIMLVGTALAAVALGMLALSSQNELAGQIISILIIENGISLFALGNRSETPWAIEIFIALDFVVLVVLASNFLKRLHVVKPPASEPDNPFLPLTHQELAHEPMTSRDYGDIL